MEYNFTFEKFQGFVLNPTIDENDKLKIISPKQAENLLKVMNAICKIMSKCYTQGNWANISGYVDNYVESDALFTYTYFLSSNPRFPYLWSYLKNKKDEYKTFLGNVCQYIHGMIGLVNDLRTLFEISQPIEIIFNNLFLFKVSNDKSSLNLSVIWDKFNEIISLSDTYFITIKCQSTIISTLSYNDKKDKEDKLETFIVYTKEMLLSILK